MATEKPVYTHEERQKFVQQAAEEYYAKETGGPAPLNRDFMQRDFGEKKGALHFKRYSAIAAAVLVVFLLGTAITSDKDVAYGDKGLLHRIYESVMGIGTDKQDEAPAEDYMESLEITTMDDLDKAVDYSDGMLYVPEYLPDGYQLEKLTIEKIGDGTITAAYDFKRGKQTLQIGEMFTAGEGQVSASGGGEMIRLKDRILYVREDSLEGRWYIDVYTEDAMILISGIFTKEEGKQIGENLKLK